MTRAAVCPTCKASMPANAGFCPGCGRLAHGAIAVEGFDDGGGRDQEVVIGGRRRRRSPVALAAMAAVLVAGVVVVSRDHGGTSSSAASTTSVAPPTTTGPSTTSGAATPTTTTSTTQLVERIAPARALGQNTGLILYLAVPRQDDEILYALDLDEGVFREIANMSYFYGELPILGDTIVIGTTSAQLLVHPEGAAKQLGDPADGVFTAGRPDAYWKVDFVDDASPTVAVLVVIGAPEQRSVSIPPGFSVFAGDGLGGLLVRGPDERTYRLPADGEKLVAIDTNSPLSAVNGRVAAVRCDAKPSCGLEVLDLTTGERHTIPASTPGGGPASLAPDGAHLAQIVRSGERETLLVVDTTTGDHLLHAPYEGLSYQAGPPRWSPDGRWLFWNDVQGLEAWNLDRIQPLTIDIPTTDRVSMHVVGVAAKS